jgi:sugar lactone lactonase YvrE
VEIPAFFYFIEIFYLFCPTSNLMKMKKTILSFALFLAVYFAFGQCGPHNINLIDTGCNYNLLQIPGVSTATQILWYNNGLTFEQENQRTLVGSITTVAGGQGIGNASNQIFYPSGVSVDRAGNLYVADKLNFRIQKFAPGSTVGVTVAGGNGQGSAANQLWDPFRVFLDSAGNIYIPDFGNNRVQKFPAGSTSATNGITIAGGNDTGSAANQLNGPVSVYVDATGNIYVADLNNNRIQKFPAGSTSATAGTTVAGGNGAGGGAAQFNSPFSVFLDSAGYIYVVDDGLNRIQKFPPGSTSSTPGVTVAGGNGPGNAANQFNAPTDMYIDAFGDLYVADLYNARVQKFPRGSTSATNGITVAGGHGTGSGFDQFSWPYGVFVDSSGYIYIADEQNNRIQRWSQPAIVGIDTFIYTSQAGNYSAIVTDSSGCASHSDTISVNHLNSYNLIYQNICHGSTYNLGGHLLSATGTYTDTITSSSGCDSIVTLFLTVFPLSYSDSVFVCQGNTFTFGSRQLSTTGIYRDTSLSVLGCDSAYTTLYLTVGSVSTNISQSICQGSTYIFGSHTLSTPGIYHDTLTAPSGCDSIVTLTLTVGYNGPYTIIATDSFCANIILSVSGASGAQQIVWNLNGALYDQDSRGLTGSVTTVAGGNFQGPAANELHAPSGVYVDGSGNIYVADAYNHRIQKFPAGSTSATNGVTVAGGNGQGNAANQLSFPNSLYVDASGNIYVTDRGNSRIQKFPAGSTSVTNATTVAGGNGSGTAANQFSSANGVYLDGAGNIYVSDNNASGDGGRIQKFPPNSTSATNGITAAGGNGYGTAANQIGEPYGLYVDSPGNIYVADAGIFRIQRFPAGSTSATNGTTVAQASGGSGSNTDFDPEGVSLDASGNIYVADYINERIVKFPANSISTTIGVTVAGGNGQGSAPNQFYVPSDIYVDASGSIYIADYLNARIQKWSQPAISGMDTIISMSSAVGSYSAIITDTAGCIGYTDTISPYSSSISKNICQGTTYTFGSHSLSTAGTYYDTLASSFSGCDSIITLTLTTLQPAMQSQTASLCSGNGFTVGSYTHYTSGTYSDTLIGASIHGCDSIVRSVLTFLPLGTDSIAASVCPGQSYTLAGHIYTTSGIYIDTLHGAGVNGCDSIVTLDLNVMHDTVTAFFTLQPASTPHLWYILNQCTGTGLSYIWSWGDSTTSTGDTPSHTYAASGYYNVCVSVTDSAGCTANYCDTNVYLFKDQSGQMVYVNVVTQLPTGINTINAENLSISYYSGAIHFSEALIAPTQLRLYDMSGRMVMKRDDFGGSVWNIPADIAQGVYAIQLQNQSYSISRKLIITR